MFVCLLLLFLACQASQEYANVANGEGRNLVRSKRQSQYYYDPYTGYWYIYRHPYYRRTTTTTTRRPIVQVTTTSHKPAEVPSSSKCACTRRFKREEPDQNLTDFRIVGGTVTKPHAYPQMALLTYDNSQMCGGTVLNEKYILTAAHCVAGNTVASKYDVVVGAYDLNDKETNRKTVTVKKVIPHKNFNTRTFENDIALLELSESLVFNSDVKATCVADNDKSYADQNGVAVGWGRTAETGSSSRVLREVTVPIITNRDCQSDYASQYTIYSSMICAGLQAGGKDTCAGDSGGPLFAGSSVQVGVTSFGLGCARREKPGVYSRVTSFTDWINDNVDITGCKFYSDD